MAGEGARTTAQQVVVVGGGIVGICSALQLQRDGHRVTVIERQGPGEGASYGNASVLASESVVPVATPGILRRVPGMLRDPLGPLALRWRYLPRLAPWLLRFLAASRPERVEEISQALAALLDGCVEAYLPLLAQAGAQDMLVRRGWIGAYTTEQGLAAARAGIALQRRRGVTVQELGVSEMRQMEPALSRALAGGFYYPDVAHVVETYALTRALAEDFVRHGGEIRYGEARRLRRGDDGRVVAVACADGELACDALVVAAGAWSRDLAGQAGARVPLDTERGYHLTLPDPAVELSRPVYAPEFGMACTPIGDALRLGGMVEMGGYRAPPDWRRAEVLAIRAHQLFPGLRVDDAQRWMGFRPSMPDSLPVIGPVPGRANAILAFGHGHLGLTLAARTGALVADLVAGRAPPIDLTPFAADRF